MRTFEIKYNDGVYAETITFNNNHDNAFIENYLKEEIKEFNSNLNKDHHITRNNIVEITK